MRAARVSRRRRAATLAVAALAIAVVVVGGALLPVQSATFRATPSPLVGRTATVCATAPDPDATATMAAVAVRQAPGREGTLTATALDADAPLLRLTEQGKGESERAPESPVVVRGEGVMATAGSGMVVSTAETGAEAGLMAAPCTPPATEHWFVGVGAVDEQRTDLVLTNPDDGEAEVDLRFYGPSGIVVVPGSPGLVVEGGTSRTVTLQSLVRSAGPLTVMVRANEGRVAATALNRRSVDLDPAGADWQVGSVPPGLTQVIPGVPEGQGQRELVVVNPGRIRAEVSIAVLGIEGAFAPVGAETLEVPAESTASVDLTGGLTGLAGAIQLSSDQPVTGAVVSTSGRDSAQPDLAIQPAVGPLVRTGVVAAARIEETDSELVLSNGGESDVQLTLEVLSYEGVMLRQDDVLLVRRGTATRRITAPAPAYVVVRLPLDAQVFGGLTYTQPEGVVAGLATVPVTSPDVASRAPQTVPDPLVGMS